MAHIHGVSDTNKCFTIDPITRKINTRCHNKAINRYDHNSERFTFEMPRYIEGHDMMTCNRVELHYTNIDAKSKNEYKGLYIVDDLQLCSDDENFVTCSWLISQNATQYVGKLDFSLRFICQAGESVDYAWQTAIASVEVADSIFNTDTVLEESVPDVLTSWMDSVVNKVYGMVEEDVLQQVKESAAELMDDEATVASFTAAAANWTAGDGEFTQTFTLEGVTAGMMVDVLVDDAVLAFIEATSGNLIHIENNQSSLIIHLKCRDTSTAITSDVVLPLKYYKVTTPEGQTSIYGSGVSIGDSAQSILEKLKTVDGTGSGLDADSVGGMDLEGFAATFDRYTPKCAVVVGGVGVKAGFNYYSTSTSGKAATIINKAIDELPEGIDTVILRGTFYISPSNPIIINKSGVRLIGENCVIVVPSSYTDYSLAALIKVQSDSNAISNVKIAHLNFTSADNQSCTYIRVGGGSHKVSNVTVEGCNFNFNVGAENWLYGVQVKNNAEKIFINNNNFEVSSSRTDYPETCECIRIETEGYTFGTISNNIATTTGDVCECFVWLHTDCVLPEGVNFGFASSMMMITGNTVMNSKIGIKLGSQCNVVTGNCFNNQKNNSAAQSIYMDNGHNVVVGNYCYHPIFGTAFSIENSAIANNYPADVQSVE